MAKKKKKTKNSADEIPPEAIIANLKERLESQKEEFEILINSKESKIGRLDEKVQLEMKRTMELRHMLEKKAMQNLDLFEGNEMSIKDKESKMKALQEENTLIKEELEYLKENLELHKEGAQQEVFRERTKLEDDIKRVNIELVRFKDFHNEKLRMQKEIEDLRQQLHEREVEQYEKLQNARSEHEQKQSDLKKNMLQKLYQKRSEMIKFTEQAVGRRTKKALQHNEELRKEISIHSSETSRLLQENRTLQEENSRMERERDIAEENFNTLLKKSNAQQQTIRMLTRKIKHLEESYRDFHQRKDLRNEQKEESVTHISNEDHEQNQMTSNLQNQFQRELSELDERLKRTELEKRNLEQIFLLQDETTRFLTSAMLEVKQKFEGSQSSSENMVHSSLDNLSAKERESAIQLLLGKLQKFEKLRRKGSDGSLVMDLRDNANILLNPATQLTLPLLKTGRGTCRKDWK